MQLPNFSGYIYEDLLDEDPFGWTYVCAHESGEQRIVRVLKSQATDEALLDSYFSYLGDPEAGISGVAPVFDHQLQGTNSLSAFATPFYGWMGQEEKGWQVTSLKKLMHLISREQGIGIIRELAHTIAGVHENSLFHGGLRPGNIFVSGDSKEGDRVRVTNFGQAFVGGLQYLEVEDVLFYASPEQIASGDFSEEKGKGWDIYAFGAIAFQLLSGHLPRLDRLRQQCLDHPASLTSVAAIQYGELTHISQHFLKQLELEKPIEWPEEAATDQEWALQRVIQNCLWFDPEERASDMREVAAAIDHLLGIEAPEPKPELQKSKRRFLPRRKKKEPSLNLLEADPDQDQEELETVDTSEVERGILRNRSTIKWQIAAVAALVLMLPLSYFALYNYIRYEKTQEKLDVEAAELQESVESQAEAYRKAIVEKQRTSEQMRSELNDVEDSKSRLMGEAKLARQILRQTQENGDQFFRLVLENRDTDVSEFQNGRRAAIVEGKKHYERLIEVYGDAPDFIVSTANALFYLGQIYKEMGEFGKSLASFGEAERRYLALLDDSSAVPVDFVRNLAIAKNSLGQLSLKSGRYSVARHYFTESSRYWTEVRSLDSKEALNAATSIHENSLEIIECELAMGRLEAALDATRSIGVQLIDLQEKDPKNDRLIGALGRSFDLAGRILQQSGSIDLAKEAFQQASDLFAEAIKLNAAIDRYQLGLGNSLARVGLLNNDITKLEGAAEVLAEVVASNPYEATYQQTLADVYGVLARNQRDGGKLKNAIQLEEEAIAILQPILRENAAAPSSLLFSYSERLAHLAELLGDAGEFDESRVPLQEAIVVLDRIASADNALDKYHRSLARARGLAGFACLKAGDKTEAKQHLQLAMVQWESLIAANPEDSDAAQAVKWTSDQLAGLQ